MGEFFGPVLISGVCAVDSVGGMEVCGIFHFSSVPSDECPLNGLQIPSFFLLLFFFFFFPKTGCPVAQDSLELDMQPRLPPDFLTLLPPAPRFLDYRPPLHWRWGFRISQTSASSASLHPIHAETAAGLLDIWTFGSWPQTSLKWWPRSPFHLSLLVG